MFLNQMNTSSINFKSKSKANIKDLLEKVFQNNFKMIFNFLTFKDTLNAKLISRSIYYLSVTEQIWTGLKFNVVQTKMEFYQDLDFVQEEPKIISKEDKNVRIHSLKKAASGIRIRQASNIKQKKIAMNTLSNEMAFRSTQIGFKRLLKPTIQSKKKIGADIVQTYLMDMVDIPKEYAPKDLIINAKDPWSVNIHRANNLCQIVKKWNEMHHKFFTMLKQSQKQLQNLIKKCTKLDKTCNDYVKLFKTDPYCSIVQYLQGSFKNLLIDEQLNKIGRIFIINHRAVIQILQSFDKFIPKAHEIYQNTTKLGINQSQMQSTPMLQVLTGLEESFDKYLECNETNAQLIKYITPSLIDIYEKLIDAMLIKDIEFDDGQVIKLENLSYCHISKKPEYFELFFHSWLSTLNKFLKLIDSKEEQKFGINLSFNKFKNMKAMCQHLWNMSKYFSKLNKQLESNQKKKSSKVPIIKEFIIFYEKYDSQIKIFNFKNLSKLQKQMEQFKNRINNLKNSIQNE